MPRFRPIARLERSAVADLWKHTLSNIPTASGRLVYLAGLRDANSGTYKHHGLFSTFGREEATSALQQSHQEAFQAWIGLPLAEKSEDLQEYLTGLDSPQEEVVNHWLKSGIYRSYVPPLAREAETELFCRDLETLLRFRQHDALRIRLRSGGGQPDQDSSRPA